MPPRHRKTKETSNAFHDVLKRKPYGCICAIDFGTSGTGFCYAIPCNGEIDIERGIILNEWPDGRGKTNTSIILDEKNTCLKFGSEAKNAAGHYAMQNEGRFFELFKMQLYSHIPNTKFVVTDSANKEIDAVVVFRESLRYIKDVFFNRLKRTIVSIPEEDVLWVLTIPAIWDDSAKLLMREAAVAAGLEMEAGQLVLALEPEAASLWCLASEELSLQQNDIYMVLDCGGGTVDITIHQVEQVDPSHPIVKEVAPASGGDWGSTSIDRAVFKLFREVFGELRYENLQKDTIGLPLLQGHVERAKCSFDGDSSFVLQLPDSLLQTPKGDRSTPIQAVTNYNKANKVKLVLKGSYLSIPATTISDFISLTVNSIVNHVKEQLTHVPNVQYIIMVGNFANCIPLQKQMDAISRQSGIKLLIPNQPGNAIMKGAVIYGLDSSAVSSRRARKTYGVRTLKPFIDGVHPLDRLEIKQGKRWCTDVFDHFVKKNQEVPKGHTVDRRYTRVGPEQLRIAVDILVSEEDEPPQFSDHYSVDVVGKHTINIPTSGNGRIITSMLFGDTEIRCRSVNDDGHEVVTECTFN